MNPKLIIPFTLLFFIVLLILAVSAADGNAAPAVILQILGGALLLFCFVVLPARMLCKFLPPRLTFGRPLAAAIILLSLFWGAVLALVTLAPQWGWRYVDFCDKVIYPFINGI